MDVKFPSHVVDRVKERQKRDCAGCGKHWGIAIMGKGSVWFVHALDESGSKTADNCVILCGKALNNCHLRIGHEGDDKNSEAIRINRDELPYFNGNPSNPTYHSYT